MGHARASLIGCACLLALAAVAAGQDTWYSDPGGELARAAASVRTPTSVLALAYPTHPVRWHIVGSSETRAELIAHLLSHREHQDVRRVYSAVDLSMMSRAQLMSLHDDSHQRRVVRVGRMVASGPQVAQVHSRRHYSSAASGGCPGGVCPIGQGGARARVRRPR